MAPGVIPGYLELGTRKVFAGSLDRPGWGRFGRGEGAALEALADSLRAELVEVLAHAGDGAPLVPKGWPVRYAARCIAWHALDHAWEMQDRTPG